MLHTVNVIAIIFWAKNVIFQNNGPNLKMKRTKSVARFMSEHGVYQLLAIFDENILIWGKKTGFFYDCLKILLG